MREYLRENARIFPRQFIWKTLWGKGEQFFEIVKSHSQFHPRAALRNIPSSTPDLSTVSDTVKVADLAPSALELKELENNN